MWPANKKEHNSRIWREKCLGVNYCCHQGCQRCDTGAAANTMATVDQEVLNKISSKKILFVKEIILFQKLQFSSSLESVKSILRWQKNTRKFKRNSLKGQRWLWAVLEKKADVSRCAKPDFLEAPCSFLTITIEKDGECLRQRLQPKAVNQEKLRWHMIVFCWNCQREKDFFRVTKAALYSMLLFLVSFLMWVLAVQRGQWRVWVSVWSSQVEKRCARQPIVGLMYFL